MPLPENGNAVLLRLDFVYLVDILILCIRMQVYFGGKKEIEKKNSVEAN